MTINELEAEKVFLFQRLERINEDICDKEKKATEIKKNLKELKEFLDKYKNEYNNRLMYLIGKGDYSYYMCEYFRLVNELTELNNRYEDNLNYITPKEKKMHLDLEDIYKDDINESLHELEEVEYQNEEFINFYDHVTKEYKKTKDKLRETNSDIRCLKKCNNKTHKRIKVLDNKIIKKENK